MSEERPNFDALYRAEDHHFWFRARNMVIGDAIRSIEEKLDPGYRVLEVGCGNGNVLRVLETICNRGEVIGSELHEEGLVNARPRVHCKLVAADIYKLPFQQPFNIIGMFDVLEHLPDDVRALESLRNVMVPGGALVLTVPAHMWLYSYVDEIAGHFRRYTPHTLRAALESAGWRIDRICQFMMPLVPAMWLNRRVAQWKQQLGVSRQSTTDTALAELKVSPLANRVMGTLLKFERPMLSRGKGLPIGTSLLAIAYNDLDSVPGSAARAA